MRTRPGKWLIVTLSVLTCLLLGCGTAQPSQPGPQGAAAQAPSGQATPETPAVKIGLSVLSPEFMTTFVAQKQGFFKQHGLDAQVVPFQGSPQTVQALLAGEIQLVEAGFTSVLSTYGKEDLVVVGETVSYPAYAFYGKQGLTSWEAIKGKKSVVGVSAIGGLDYIVTRYAMTKAGLKPDDSQFIAAGAPTQRAAALIAGRLDLVASTPPGSYLLDNAGLAPIGQLTDSLPKFPMEVYQTTRKFYDDNPKTIAALMAAHREAADWIRSNPDATTDIVLAATKANPDQRELYRKAVAAFSPYLAPGELSKDGYRLLAQFYVDDGKVKDPVETVLKRVVPSWN